MNIIPQQLTLQEWDTHYKNLCASGMKEPSYGDPLSRHADDGDHRLTRLKFDNSRAALNLWNFLLTEEDRLHAARQTGRKIVGTMKDLGTIPVMAYSLPNVTAFYPDGAWWIPCIMELNAGLLEIADSLGIDESFCPVRAMLGAFITEAHFPKPDLLTCSVGATCDDFSAIAQRLNGLGFPILWWEIPHRRKPDSGEISITLPGGHRAPLCQIECIRNEMVRIKTALEELAGSRLDNTMLSAGIRKANEFRTIMKELRHITFTAKTCPLPALELLIAEMIAIHFCSDQDEAISVISHLLNEVKRRTKDGAGFFGKDAVKVFWVNPVADLRAMNLLEECGGRLCGTDFLFAHALDPIPNDIDPLTALAQTALSDPMAGTATERAERICRDITLFGAEAVIISRIPGASHCAMESSIIADIVMTTLKIPTMQIEVPPLSDSIRPSIKTRIEGLIEIVHL